MGNNTSLAGGKTYSVRSKHGGLRDGKRTPIYRVLRYLPGTLPDVDSLGFPFRVCRNIFQHLSPPDLASCMRVCKEWRSLIDTCDFWKAYIKRHYGNTRTEPHVHSVLYWWKHNQCDGMTSSMLDPADQPFVFRPFPDLWACDVIVPCGLQSPSGSVDVYHNFIKAMDSLASIRDRILYYGLNNIVHVCMFHWLHAAFKPSPADVMNVFNAHVLLTKGVELRASVQTEDDQARIVPPQGVDYKGQTFFIDVFSRCFQLGTEEWIVAFHCSNDLLEPAPGFMVTRLSEGWVGGLMYAV